MKGTTNVISKMHGKLISRFLRSSRVCRTGRTQYGIEDISAKELSVGNSLKYSVVWVEVFLKIFGQGNQF